MEWKDGALDVEVDGRKLIRVAKTYLAWFVPGAATPFSLPITSPGVPADRHFPCPGLFFVVPGPV